MKKIIARIFVFLMIAAFAVCAVACETKKMYHDSTTDSDTVTVADTNSDDTEAVDTDESAVSDDETDSDATEEETAVSEDSDTDAE